MKSLILSSFVVIGIAQQIKCPDEIDRSVYCTQEYAPVCAYNTQGFESKQELTPTHVLLVQMNQQFLIKMIRASSLLSLFNKVVLMIQLLNLQLYIHVISQKLMVQQQTVFRRRYVDYLTKMFHAQKNLVLYGMYSCISCTSFNVESYFYGDCNDYSGSMLSQIRAQNLSLNSELKQIINYECSQTKPTSCDDNVSEVCASYHCKDSTCNQEYTNECQACQDSTTLSYQRNSCEFSDGKLLTLAIIIQLLL